MLPLIIISYKIYRKKLFNCLEYSKTSKFSGRLLIVQNDSLDDLLLDDIFLIFEKGRNYLTNTFACLFWLMGKFCNAFIKLFAGVLNISLPAFGVESLKSCCRCYMKSFVCLHPVCIVWVLVSRTAAILKVWPSY